MKKIAFGLLAAACGLLLGARSHAALAPTRVELDNGMVLLVSEQRALPIVSIEVLIDAGSSREAPEELGVANLTARLLTDGTERRTAVQISEALDFIGAQLSTAAAQDHATVSLTVLKKDLASGLEILADILTAASFPQEEIERQKLATVAALKARDEKPGDIAQRTFAAALYPGSRYGQPVEGNETSVRSLHQAAIREFYRRNYRPNRSIIAIVGDVSPAEAAQTVGQAFRSWRKGDVPAPQPTPGATGAPRVLRVNRRLAQANIVIGHQGILRSNPDYYAVQVMNYILGGGGFSSRVMNSVRNERGLAYSVYSSFDAQKSHGAFELVMQTKNETAEQAVGIARAEIRRMREQPVGHEELSDAKDFLTGSFPLRLDTDRKLANFLAQMEFFGLGLDYPDRYANLVSAITAADVSRVAQRYLHLDQLITVVVGDQEKIGNW